MENKLINGIKIYAPSSRQSLIDYAFAHSSLLVAVNAEKIITATAETRGVINRNVGYPDGVGAVMALQKKGAQGAVKMAGCELWLDIVRAHYRDKRFYLVGGRDAVIEQTVSQLKAEFPGIEIVNYRNGFLRDSADRQSLIEDVVNKKPDVVFVAMGSPRQELLMEEMQQRHMAVYQGLGGSFDVYTGVVARAPAWWIEHRLEWLYRLILEPTRIKRQVHYLRFMVALVLGRL